MRGPELKRTAGMGGFCVERRREIANAGGDPRSPCSRPECRRVAVDRIPFSRCTRPIYPSPSSLSFLPKPYTPFRSRLSFSAPALESNHLASTPSGPRQVPCSRTRWLCFPLLQLIIFFLRSPKTTPNTRFPDIPKTPAANLNYSPYSPLASFSAPRRSAPAFRFPALLAPPTPPPPLSPIRNSPAPPPRSTRPSPRALSVHSPPQATRSPTRDPPPAH